MSVAPCDKFKGDGCECSTVAQAEETVRPSVSMPKSMKDDIEERREKGVSHSEYIREAVEGRFRLEDAAEWPIEEE